MGFNFSQFVVVGGESDLFVLQKECRSGSYERAFTTLPVMENQ